MIQVFFLEGTEYSKLIKTLNNELENVTKWLNANRLTVNMKKTHYMVFHRAKLKTTGQDVVMQNSALTCVTTTKFLGVIIDHKFKWNDHITYVKRKISKSIGILYKIRRFLNMNTLIQMYHSFVFPYLIYCVEIWGNASTIHLDPLKKIQKKSFRAITFSEFSAPSEPLFQRSNILNFDKLVFQRICLMMFKHHIGVVPKPISDLFQTNDNFHMETVHVTHKLFELLLVKAKPFIKHLTTLDHWLGIIYLVKLQPMCLIYVLKTMPNYIYRQIVYHKLD